MYKKKASITEPITIANRTEIAKKMRQAKHTLRSWTRASGVQAGKRAEEKRAKTGETRGARAKQKRQGGQERQKVQERHAAVCAVNNGGKRENQNQNKGGGGGGICGSTKYRKERRKTRQLVTRQEEAEARRQE